MNKSYKYGESNNFCSRECYCEYRSRYYVGEKHPMFGRPVSEENKQRIVEQYNFARYASLGTYLSEKTGLSVDTLGDVLENRSKIYDEIFFSENPFPFPWTMSNISQALYWFLDNGWMKRSDGTFSDTPNFNFELSMLLQVDTDKVSNYSKTRDNIDGILFDYCEREIPGFIEYLKKI